MFDITDNDRFIENVFELVVRVVPFNGLTMLDDGFSARSAKSLLVITPPINALTRVSRINEFTVETSPDRQQPNHSTNNHIHEMIVQNKSHIWNVYLVDWELWRKPETRPIFRRLEPIALHGTNPLYVQWQWTLVIVITVYQINTNNSLYWSKRTDKKEKENTDKAVVWFDNFL